jgi:hypothetical protein
VVNSRLLARIKVCVLPKVSCLEIAYFSYTKRCKQAEKPAAQTAHLVFADTQANAEKTKRAVFCQRSTKKIIYLLVRKIF